MADPLTLGVLGGSALLGVGGTLLQNKLGRDNMEYQWNNYYSPQAQVRNMAKAGINPAVAFGNQSPTLSSGGQLQMPDAPNFGVGTTAINELGSYFKSLADAKKAGADTKLVGAQTDKALTEVEAQKLANEFTKKYGNQKWLNDLSMAYQNILLAQKTNDLKEVEKAIAHWKEVGEKAISESNEHTRDMLAKDLANKDTEIRLSNKLLQEKANTEKSVQAANLASARYSHSLADTEDGLRELKKASQTILNGIEAVKYEEDSKTLQSKIDKLAAEVGIAKWTAILQEVEARDKNAYNAIQRLIMGKSIKGDASTIINALANYENFTFKH